MHKGSGERGTMHQKGSRKQTPSALECIKVQANEVLYSKDFFNCYIYFKPNKHKRYIKKDNYVFN